MRLGVDTLTLRPVAPPGNATALAVRGLHWRARRLELRVEARGDATLWLLEGAPVLVRCGNASDVRLPMAARHTRCWRQCTVDAVLLEAGA